MRWITHAAAQLVWFISSKSAQMDKGKKINYTIKGRQYFLPKKNCQVNNNNNIRLVSPISHSNYLFQLTEAAETISEPPFDEICEPADSKEAALCEESLAHSNDEENSETSASTEGSSDSEPKRSSLNDEPKKSEQKQQRKKRRLKKKVRRKTLHIS